MSRRHYANNAPQRTLASSITNSATSCAVSGTFAGWPVSFPFHATLDLGTLSEEIVLVTNIVGTTATITRAQDGTVATAHAAGATLDLTVVALDFDEANNHVNLNAGVHGRSGNLVGDSDTQTLSNKTLSAPVLDGNVTSSDGTVNVTGNVTATGDLSGVNAVATGTLTVGGKLYGTAPVIRVYTAGATWTKPANLKAARVRVVGAGGGAGGCTGAGTGRSASGGGGGGGYSEDFIPVASLGATEAVTVGAAGTGGTDGTTDGGTGGTSSFGAHGSATGGAGGKAGGTSSTANAAVLGGAGGVGSGGLVNATGQAGSGGLVIGAPPSISGNGGASVLGGGALGRTAVAAGLAGGNYGAGGGGALASTANQTGGAGAVGAVIVEEFYY